MTKTKVSSRYYPYGEKAAHLTGYIKTITAEQLKKAKDGQYSDTSKIGIAGLENVYEDKAARHDRLENLRPANR